MNLLDFLSEENRQKNTRWLDEKSNQFNQFMNRFLPRNPNDKGHMAQFPIGLMETISPATDVVDAQSSSEGLMNELSRGSKINAFGQGARMLASLGSLALPGNLVRTYDDLSKNIVANYEKFKNLKVDPFDDVSKAEKIKALSKKPNIEDALIKKYPNVDLDIYETDKGLTLSKIVLPKDDRNKGIGSKILEDLTAYADKNNLTIGVTPDSTFGGNKNKLKSFYKKFGFLDNKGRNKDFTFRETMVRQPFEINLNPAQQQSQDIINLLKSGKADEVTDEMLANADQKYLFENYDLPMDTKSRMKRAKEMGLVEDAFHGTDYDFDAFSDDPTFMSDQPAVADTYTNFLDDGNTGMILPLKVPQANMDIPYLEVFGKGQTWGSLKKDNEVFDPSLGETDLDTVVSLRNPNLSEGRGKDMFGQEIKIPNNKYTTRDITATEYEGRPNAIQTSSNKGVIFHDIVDRGGFGYSHLYDEKLHNYPSQVRVEFDPKNIRSKFARFDPRLKNLKNLSAGLIPIGLLPFLSNNEGLEDDRPN